MNALMTIFVWFALPVAFACAVMGIWSGDGRWYATGALLALSWLSLFSVALWREGEK